MPEDEDVVEFRTQRNARHEAGERCARSEHYKVRVACGRMLQEDGAMLQGGRSASESFACVSFMNRCNGEIDEIH